ncbi:glutathione peroxidase [Massilia sp. W12]|uniref:glutathione peroxidase n=1 Tax=Massilia sp. W12 TaxID=3126507 RepID=UPI0030D06110
MATVHDFEVNFLQGKAAQLSAYKGKVLLIVNTASECGFTPQYKGLEALFQQYQDKGLVVLGFPCNQFGGQEPGDALQIGAFCEKNYGVTFPLSEKVDVNGDGAHPLFVHLKEAAPGLLGSKAIKWNFTKFLVGKDGRVRERFAPTTKPEELVKDIEKLLAE